MSSIYSPLCCFRLIWLSFFCWTQVIVLIAELQWMNTECFGHKSTIKLVQLASFLKSFLWVINRYLRCYLLKIFSSGELLTAVTRTESQFDSWTNHSGFVNWIQKEKKKKDLFIFVINDLKFHTQSYCMSSEVKYRALKTSMDHFLSGSFKHSF